MKMFRMFCIIGALLCLLGTLAAAVGTSVPEEALIAANNALSRLKHEAATAPDRSLYGRTIDNPEGLHLLAPYEECWFKGDDVFKYLDGLSDNIKAYASECMYAFPLLTADGRYIISIHIRQAGPETPDLADDEFYYSGGTGPWNSEFPEMELMKRYYASSDYTVSMLHSQHRLGVFVIVESNDGNWQGICPVGGPSAAVVPQEYDDEGRYTWTPMNTAAPMLRKAIELRRQIEISRRQQQELNDEEESQPEVIEER